jgi:hypothetical protein
MILSAKIDLTAIDKSKIFVGKTGKKYIDITLLENREGVPDQYGNSFMVVQDLGREARLAGQKGPILGNAQYRVKNSSSPAPQESPSTPRYREAPQENNPDLDSSVPF